MEAVTCIAFVEIRLLEVNQRPIAVPDCEPTIQLATKGIVTTILSRGHQIGETKLKKNPH